jgi:hypothetical protein
MKIKNISNVLILTGRVFLVFMVLTAGAGVIPLNARKGAQILKIVPDAKPVSLGGAFSAYPEDAASVFYNPAGLARINYIQVPLAKNYLLRNVKNIFKYNEQEYYGGVCSLRDIWMSNVRDRGTIAVTYNRAEATYLPGRTGGSMLKDDVLTISYAKSIYATKADPVMLAVGFNAKFFKEEEAGKDEAEGSAFDAGLQYKFPGKNLYAGLTVMNIGKAYTRDSEELELPTKGSVGLYGRALKKKLGIHLDVIMESESDIYAAAAASYLLLQPLEIRLGNNSRINPHNGITGGLGLILKDIDILFIYIRELNIDFALPTHGYYEHLQRISLKVKLGSL